MDSTFEMIQNLLRTRAELQARLQLIPYEGTVEIKEQNEKKYLYIRKREAGKIKSTYVGVYSEELHLLLLRSVKEARELRKSLRRADSALAACGYERGELPIEVILNLELARACMKVSIYEQAVLEGLTTTFPDTETIIDNGKVNHVSAEDVQKILNLKHAWEFILDEDILQVPSDFYVCQYIARLVNEGFYQEGGRVRGVPVKIGGSRYIPPLPVENVVRESIAAIVADSDDPVGVAIEIALYVMKAQIFNDGNKRTALLFANHYLIAHAAGLMVVPEECVAEFKRLLVQYYENENTQGVKDFLREKCIRRVK